MLEMRRSCDCDSVRDSGRAPAKKEQDHFAERDLLAEKLALAKADKKDAKVSSGAENM